MHTITLHIPTRSGKTREKHYHIPEKVEEITRRQWRMIARAVDLYPDPVDQKMVIFAKLAKIKKPSLFQGQHIIHAINLLGFLDDAELRIKTPLIKGAGLFRAPRKRLNGFSGWQMALCDTILQAVEHKKEASNDLLTDFCMANTTLFGLSWSDFAADFIAKPYFKHLVTRSTKLALFIQYRSMRRIFPELYENAFSTEGPDSKFPSLGWDGTMVRLAGDKFGTPEKVKRTPAHQLFIYLEDCKRDEIRQEVNASFSKIKANK
jgi:hypothetical protein